MELTWNLSFSVLGGLSASRNGEPLDLGGPKQRLVLAFLLLNDGAPLSGDQLTYLVWGDDVPNRAAASIQAYISNLRKQIEPERAPRTQARFLVTKPAGYALEIDPTELDLRRFQTDVGVGYHLLQEGDPFRSEEVIAEALDDAGPLLPEFQDHEYIALRARAHEADVVTARTFLFDARLALGESRSMIGDLRTFVEQHPLDERLWAQLALALYRAGQQTDALRALSDARRVLGEEVGVEPGPALKALETDILEQSPSLIWIPSPSTLAAAPATTPALAPTASLFVGRDHEIDVLRTAVQRAAAGEGTAIVVSGEPGIGKTRLVEELLHSIVTLGVATAWARCPESAATSSFFAISEVASQLEGLGVLDLSNRLGFGALDENSDQLAFYQRTVESLRAMTRPAVVVLDDVQWADPGTLRLVEYMAGELRTLPIALVVTTRPTSADSPEALVDCLSELARAHGGVRLDLDGLAVDAVHTWIERRTSRTANAEVAALVHDRSGGNPFFAQELVELLVGENRLDGDSVDASRVPAAVADVVRRRVGRLPDATQRMLSVASVVGRAFELDVVARVADEPLTDVLDAVDAAVAAGLVEADPRSLAGFRFSHALVAEALETELAPSRRARLHATAASAIAQMRVARLDDHLAELAHHALAGAVAGSAVDGVRWSISAGERAEERRAPEDAAGHYERALGVVDLAHPGDLQVRFDLLRSLGRAWAAAGSEERAQAVFADAIEVADRLDDRDAMVASALALVHPTLWQPGEYRGRNDRLVAMVDLVLDRLGPDGDVRARALLSGFRANLAYYVSSPEELDTWSAAAVELARSSGDPDLLARVLVQRLQSIWFAPNAAAQLAISDEVLGLLDSAGLDDPQLLAVAELQRICALYQLGTYDPVAFDEVDALVRAKGSPIQVLEIDAFAAARLACEGRYVEAHQRALEAEDLFRRTARRSDAAVLFGSKLMSWVDRGMLDEIVEMTATVGNTSFGPSTVEMTGYVLLEFGLPDEARATVGPVGSLPDLPYDWMWLSTTCNAAMVRAALGDAAACEVLYERLLPLSGQVWIVGSVPVCGCVDLALGRMAGTLGRHDDALRHIEIAIGVDGRMGARAWLARSLEAKADLTGDAADRQAALDLATEIGCMPVLRRMGALDALGA